MWMNPEEGKIEVSIAPGVAEWHGYAFVDLRPGDVFRYVNQRWVEYTVAGLPFKHSKHGIMAIEVNGDKTQIRKWRKAVAMIKQGLTEQAREMWKHLRPWGKRDFWGRQRRADKKALRRRDDD